MRVAIIDVGSNTVRLLVADRSSAKLTPVHEARTFLGLGEEVELLGRIRAERLARVAACAASYARAARELGALAVEVIVTAPGRQSQNADDLVAALATATGARTRVLSAEEEGRLAYEGAVAALPSIPASVAVCDVGGGSTELVVGTARGGPAWARSVDLGSLRLTRRFLAEDPPGKKALAVARDEVRRSLDGMAAPIPILALATGGTARAVAKLVSLPLGGSELTYAVRRLAKRSSGEIAKRYGIDPARARTLAAGAVILAEVQERVGVPFDVARGGLREGAALAALEELAAA
ncbi:MAG: hypothetical protein M3377_03440 [Actinomycetota bacterium]|nr:hypothetical protein [Actinomycetota bacterium]